MKAEKKPAAWPQDIYAVFKQARIRQVAYVPDAGQSQLIPAWHADNDMRAALQRTADALALAVREGGGNHG